MFTRKFSLKGVQWSTFSSPHMVKIRKAKTSRGSFESYVAGNPAVRFCLEFTTLLFLNNCFDILIFSSIDFVGFRVVWDIDFNTGSNCKQIVTVSYFITLDCLCDEK